MDFQKVGEVIFNNEKFNILKPTTHVISDYFKEFMLRTGDSNFPTKRLFVDDNGLRHFWTGFDKKTQSLRKTDDIDTSLIDNTENAYKNKDESKNKTTVGYENTRDKNDNDSYQNDKHSNEVSESEVDNAENNYSVEEDAVTSKSVTFKSLLDKKKRMFRSGSVVKESLRDNDKDKKTTKAAKTNAPAKNDTTTKDNTDTTMESAVTKKNTKKEDKVVATTTFFCPFFGVITMSAFMD